MFWVIFFFLSTFAFHHCNQCWFNTSDLAFYSRSPPFFGALLRGRKKSPNLKGSFSRDHAQSRGVRLFRMCEMLLITRFSSLPCNSRPSTWLRLYGFVLFCFVFLLSVCRFIQMRRLSLAVQVQSGRRQNAARLKPQVSAGARTRSVSSYVCALLSVPLLWAFFSFFPSFSSPPRTFNEIQPKQPSQRSAVCLVNRWLAG